MFCPVVGRVGTTDMPAPTTYANPSRNNRLNGIHHRLTMHPFDTSIPCHGVAPFPSLPTPFHAKNIALFAVEDAAGPSGPLDTYSHQDNEAVAAITHSAQIEFGETD
ncbi:hypothetical protein Vretimale_18882 [Volvox reticuliferus]|uniref:Uncharacterized protein n=1 Tax=Volvox reticuliferus TaxID=1737510 RepID=A0A8J4GVR4_9CHLO|nr:hypothetical protein Vretimale_18882 [Volvox reticuliferus]